MQNLDDTLSLIYILLILQLLLFRPAIPLALTEPTYSITKWWCWYFDDQFMSGWAGPCVWTHFHRFLLKTFQSFQSKRGFAKITGRLLKKNNKKTKNKYIKNINRAVYCGLREETEIEKEMYQKAFCPNPPRTTTSARLAAKSTNYWLVVGENSAWQQLPRWPGLCVNTKIPLLLLILLLLLTFYPPPSAPCLPVKQRSDSNSGCVCETLSPW